MAVTYLIEALVGLATLAVGLPLLRRSTPPGFLLVVAGAAALIHAVIALVA